jgi:mRNA-degrading endonuclease RelE of RelBE toxin-antitoxin system
MVKKWQKVVHKTLNREKIEESIAKILQGDLNWLDIINLEGKKNYYRCRIWDFRIIFMKDETQKNHIMGAGHRGDIYKNI